MSLSLTWKPKAVIGIVGKSNTGKSRLLREFAQKLKWDAPAKVNSGKKSGDWLTKSEGDIRVGGDYKGFRVAIMSGADDADTIIRAFILVAIWRCDILIIATHPKKSNQGLSLSWVALEATIAAYGIEDCSFIEKKDATDSDRERIARELKERLEKVMSSLPESSSASHRNF